MIDQFEGKYAFLSNFYPSPFIYDGIEYPTVEHFFQASKTLDIQKKKAIVNAGTPGQSKRMGRQVELRPDWENVKIYIMSLGLKLKFSDPALAQKLIDTGDEELIEGNWWGDRFWGRCEGTGKNMLGQLLMDLRKELRNDNVTD